MEKPISIILAEAKMNILNVVNDSNLHPCILLSIIKDIYEEVERTARLQYNKEKQEYESSLSDN